ncbi:MAG: DNA polymerase III subunit delta [Myxococcales bacterium]|nr:DNA polymerase III subunit delta [Myxococcales bacterium]
MDPIRLVTDSLRQPAAVYILVGGEGILRRQALALIREGCVSGPVAAFNDATFTAGTGGDTDPMGFADIVRTAPMMAVRRLVVIRQIEEANVALLEALLTYVQAPIDSTVLVLTGEKFPGAVGGTDRGLRIVNAVKKSGVVVKLEVEASDRAALAREAARKLGAQIEPSALILLQELSGDDLSALLANVEKCAGFIGSDRGTITEAVVEEVCVSTAEADSWGITNAIIARDRNRALETLHRLLEDGEAPHKLLGGIVWQLRQVLTLQDGMRRGIPEAQMGLRMHPRAAASIRALIQKRAVSPSAVLDEIATVNRAMNSSRAGDRRVFEAWVVRLTEL